MRRVLSGGKHPDLCEHVLLRGRARERGSRLTQEEHGESPAPRNTAESATMGCSSSFGGGEPQATSTCGVACEARGGPSLQAVRPTPLIVVVSTRPRRNLGGVVSVARKRRFRRATDFGISANGELAAPGAECRWSQVWLAVRSPSKEGGLSHADAPKGSSREAEGNAEDARLQKESCVQGGRGSGARGACPRVVQRLQKSIGGVGLRKAYARHFTRFGRRKWTGV